MMNSTNKLGFVYRIEHLRNGEVIDSETVHNLVPSVGQNHILDVILKGGTAYPNWYIGLFEGNYTPTTNDTMATVASNATECVAYSEATREAFVGSTPAGGSCTNTDSKAEFTFTAGKTLYGGFMSSNNAKSSNTGMLISIVRFTNPKVVAVGDVLRVTAGIEMVSA